MAITLICQHCGASFNVKPSRAALGTAKYCSYSCSNAVRVTQVARICAHCGDEFRTIRSYVTAGGGKYCSTDCYKAARPAVISRDCLNCGSIFEARPSRVALRFSQYCCRACYFEHRREQNHRGRSGWAYNEWRSAVFERDGFTCRDCGKKGVDLQAHHIKSWATHADLRFDVANGLTLCLDCHAARHPNINIFA